MIRYNNPGNIRVSNERWQGEVWPQQGEFKRFTSLAYGYRAMIKILLRYINVYHLTDLTGILDRWAPPEDHNDTPAYINYVASRTGIGAYQAITTPVQLMQVVAAMTEVEQSAENSYDLAQIQDGYNLLNSNNSIVSPNSNASSQAGFGGLGVILMIGLGIGMLNKRKAA